MTRSFLGIALVGLWPLFRALGAKSWRDIGIVSPAQYWKKLGAGFALGFLSLAMVAFASLIGGARSPATTFNHLGQKLTTAALSAIVVGVLEEILFRGGIFGALRKSMNSASALYISSGIYALVHFLGNPKDDGPIFWNSGLLLLPQMFESFTSWQQLVPGFLNLTLAGAVLALAYQRTGNLYFSIGVHSGWIFWLKSYGVLTRPVAGANPWIWGGNKMIDGWLALLVLTGTLFWLSRRPAMNQQGPLWSEKAMVEK